MNNALEQRLVQLEQRLQQAESQLAITNLMTRYGMAADCGDIATALNCFSDAAVYIVSAPTAGREDCDAAADLVLRGHAAISNMLNSDMHQSLIPNCAHTVGPATIEVDGNTARATSYSRLYRREDESFELMRLSINEWRFTCEGGCWLIISRESRLIGEPQAEQLLQAAAFDPTQVAMHHNSCS
jgi:hypothetical protein